MLVVSVAGVTRASLVCRLWWCILPQTQLLCFRFHPHRPLSTSVRMASIERATKHASHEVHPGEKSTPMQFSPSLIDR
jgi:hypothetical protein